MQWHCEVIGPSVPAALRELDTTPSGPVQCTYEGSLEVGGLDDITVFLDTHVEQPQVSILLNVQILGPPAQWFVDLTDCEYGNATDRIVVTVHAIRFVGDPGEDWEVTLTPIDLAFPVPLRRMELPACSTCGYAVEFLRSCYVGSWRLYKDRPDVLTKGRYYFSPPDTPHYPNFHLLGSQTWLDRQHDPSVPLGEVLERTQWYDGAGPVTVVPSVRVGSKDCIADGEEYKNRIALPMTTDGVPSTCFDQVKPGPVDDRFAFLFDVASCVTQRFYAAVISMLYVDDEASITEAFGRVLGADTHELFFLPAEGNRPGHALVVQGQNACLVTDGTRQFQTLALQGAYSLAGPISFGAFSTLPLWYSSATRAIDFIGAHGVTANSKIVLSGHSYGGVVSAIANARFARTSIGDPPRLLTFGMPKPGDDRLTSLLTQPECIFVVNDDDLVTVLPPDVSMMNPILPFWAGFFPLEWFQWAWPIGPVVMLRDGTVDGRKVLNPATSVLLNLVDRLLFSQEIAFIGGHTIGEYGRRLALRCPDVPG
jgi:hypothetical protein